MKTNELTGAALDWAVAKCEGIEINIDNLYDPPTKAGVVLRYGLDDGDVECLFQPSINWAQGGPIIELEEITLAWGKDTEDWWACVGDSRRFDTDTPDGVTTFVDPQPLIAAMRCYVASKLGDEVEIPEGLEL